DPAHQALLRRLAVTDLGTGLLRLADTDGGTFDFNDYAQTANPPGTLKRYTAPGGDTLEVQAYANGRMQTATRASGSTTDAYVAASVGGGVNDGRVASVTHQRTAGG